MKLKYQIIALNICTLLLMLVILGGVITAITDNYNLNNALTYLQSQGDYAAIYIEQYALNKMRNIFDVPNIMETDANFLAAVLKETVKCRVQLYSNNKLLGDSDGLTSQNEPIRPEVLQTFSKKSAYFIKKGPVRTFYYAAPITVGKKYNYSVAFTYSLTEADRVRHNTIRMFIFTGMLLSVFSIFFSTIISNRITFPVKVLNQATRQFSQGQLDSRSDVSSKGEIGELSDTFNSMADSIQEMVDKLNYEKEKQKSFFDNFTHEIRTPLTTILGYTELLWKTNDEEVRDKSLYHITSEGKRMLKMIEQLLELSKLKRFDFELHKSLVSAKKLVEEACDSLQYKAKRYNIAINLHLENAMANVDPDLFKQVIINIIDNSIKYSHSPSIDVQLKKGRKLKLTISDHGCGIDEESLENVFEPYFKADKSHNSQTEGWGLGLSIAKEIIEKHGGGIEIFSVPGKGTQVEITI